MRVLVTGFEPFGGDAVNESWQAVTALADGWLAERDGAELVTARLPVTFTDGPGAMVRLVHEVEPAVVVATGLAAGTPAVRLERVAINLMDARIPDNAASQPIDEAVVPGGPAAYFSTLPIKASLRAAERVEVPTVASHTAGTYVCNAVFYALQHAVADRPGVRSGFVHVPRAAQLDPAASARVLRTVVLTAAAAVRGELSEPRVAAGAEH
ncbi:pyroglutamyl-peptidase I [Isoptericola sediminis]|uniref:Pyrrolidone-carboxylate peptidase n=1 Tax=Isoptericola sediminis TaxID=2733572 RepID=A0A849K1P2_9MICO|nr:pyroglutamyl-peptidase I [Isoptericola sediminis]